MQYDIRRSIEKASVYIENSVRTIVFTGAGISSESGIPVFRGSSGLWDRYNPALYGNPVGLALAFLFSAKRLTGFVLDSIGVFLSAKPNAAHIALAALEESCLIDAVITQNVDNLHREAGSKRILEMHGNIFRTKCLRCGSRKDLKREDMRNALRELEKEAPKRRDLLRFLAALSGRCSCGGRRRSDVVLFGEHPPSTIIDEAFKLASTCDCIIAAGTSFLVYPAALIPLMAYEIGAKLIEINPENTRLSSLASTRIPLPAALAFPMMLNRLGLRESIS